MFGIGPKFVISTGPAYARLDVGLKLFKADAKHMPMPNLGLSEVTKIKRAIMFICTSYASHMLC
jgi:hypothetical protein